MAQPRPERKIRAVPSVDSEAWALVFACSPISTSGHEPTERDRPRPSDRAPAAQRGGGRRGHAPAQPGDPAGRARWLRDTAGGTRGPRTGGRDRRRRLDAAAGVAGPPRRAPHRCVGLRDARCRRRRRDDDVPHGLGTRTRRTPLHRLHPRPSRLVDRAASRDRAQLVAMGRRRHPQRGRRHRGRPRDHRHRVGDRLSRAGLTGARQALLPRDGLRALLPPCRQHGAPGRGDLPLRFPRHHRGALAV